MAKSFQRVDSDAVLSRVDIVDVVAKYVDIQKKGSFYAGLCPFHNDSTASLEVVPKKQIYKCMACGAGGDAIDFLTRRGATFHQAIAELTGGADASGGEVEQRVAKPKAQPKAPAWEPIAPVPLAAYEPAPSFNHHQHGVPAHIWRWNDAHGDLVGYTCRFDLPDGEKQVLPYSYATNGQRTEWRWLGFRTPRAPFNADKLAQYPEKTVIVVEGEKTAEACERLIDSAVVVTWLGGSNGVHLTDWSPLKGRKVVFWPDNDPQGAAAMLHINELLAGQTALAKWVRNPEDAAKGWDVADAADWSADDAKKYIRANTFDVPAPVDAVPMDVTSAHGTPVKVWFSDEFGTPYYFGFFEQRGAVAWRFVQGPALWQPEPAPEPAPDAAPLPDEMPMFLPAEQPDNVVHFDGSNPNEVAEDDEPFRFLGFNKSESGGLAFYFYVIRPKTVVRLTASGVAKTAALIQLAPLDWWEHKFIGKQGLDINAAVNWLLNGGMAAGPYRDQLIRGRGAWLDAGRVVLHAGDHLIVDGQPLPLGRLDTKFIYEWSTELELSTANPVGSDQSSQLIKLLELLNWEREINSYLLAGWCVLAPVCGALKWRPHIWLTGAAGTGKSWVFESIVRKLLGEVCLPVQGEATEAGVRQTLGSDALPVVFDEAEGENQRAQARMQTVLGLMRSASSSDGGVIMKGTGNGVAKTYRIRSCFAFASIAVQLVQQSDRSRVTVLGLRKASGEAEEKERKWKQLQAQHVALITPAFVAGLHARTIRLLPIITENARVFSAAAAAELGEQRSGDQIGTLLAGAYSLTSERVITYEKALAWIRSKDWTEEKSLDKTKDETACLAYLFEQSVRVEGEFSTVERSVGELVEIAAGQPMATAGITPLKAVERLKRFGMKVDKGFLVISNTSEQIKTALGKTQWAHNHNKILLRIDGSVNWEATKFGPGLKTRAVGIPLELMMN
jgi:putative DNA primase/helicase